MAVYADRSADQANQGDLFEDVPFGLPREHLAWGMIVSHDCDCDKFLKPNTPIPEDERPHWPITVTPVHPIEFLTGGRPKAVRANAMPRYFYLPAEDGLPELVADLWLEQPVPMEQLLECRRLGSLSTEWRSRLWTQIIRLRTGRDVTNALAKALQEPQ